MKKRIAALLAAAVMFSMPLTAYADTGTVYGSIAAETTGENQLRCKWKVTVTEGITTGTAYRKELLDEAYIDADIIADINDDGRIMFTLYASDSYYFEPPASYTRTDSDKITVRIESAEIGIDFDVPEWYGEETPDGKYPCSALLSASSSTPVENAFLTYDGNTALNKDISGEGTFTLYADDRIRLEKGSVIGISVIKPSSADGYICFDREDYRLVNMLYDGTGLIKAPVDDTITVWMYEKANGSSTAETVRTFGGNIPSKPDSECGSYEWTESYADKEGLKDFNFRMLAYDSGIFTISVGSDVNFIKTDAVKLFDLRLKKDSYDICLIPDTDREQTITLLHTTDKSWHIHDDTEQHTFWLDGITFAADGKQTILFVPKSVQAESERQVVTLRKDLSIIVPTCKKTMRGDIDLDGTIGVTDAVMLRRYLLTDLDALPYWENADVLHDNKLNALDLTALKFLLLQG